MPGVGLAVVAVVLLVMALTLSSASTIDVTDLEVGDCFDLDVGAGTDDEVVELDPVDVIDCDEPHDAQVVSVGDLNPDGELAYPDDAELFEMADGECAAITPSDDRFGIVSIVPTEATWEARRGRYVCVAVTIGAVPVTGDHAAIATQSGA